MAGLQCTAQNFLSGDETRADAWELDHILAIWGHIPLSIALHPTHQVTLLLQWGWIISKRTIQTQISRIHIQPPLQQRDLNRLSANNTPSRSLLLFRPYVSWTAIPGQQSHRAILSRKTCHQMLLTQITEHTLLPPTLGLTAPCHHEIQDTSLHLHQCKHGPPHPTQLASMERQCKPQHRMYSLMDFLTRHM